MLGAPPARMNGYEYGIIGNGRSCALVSREGSIDWCCLADFDSPSVFAALLDQTKGGCFAVQPAEPGFSTEQHYLPHTNVLRTRFLTASGVFETRIQIMYGLRGQKKLTETVLPWLDGYAGSRPVRVGNAAWSQQQNDIYGVLLDVIHAGFLLFRQDTLDLEALWTVTRGIVRHIEAHWQDPDHGIWEFRGEPRHFTFSKVMCWLGLDRAARIAALVGMNEYSAPWRQLAERIRADVFAQGFDDKLGAFTQSYGSPHLDAANLLFHRLGFIPADDPRWISSVRATQQALSRDGLLYRYRHQDDFGTPDSAFLVCSFWMVQALVSIGDQQAARQLFADILRCGNHLGLFSEDADFATRRQLGNFPQAYSHLALIDTALLLDDIPGNAKPFVTLDE